MNTALPQDPALPQLAQALDGERMAQVFAGLLQGCSGAQLQRCEIERIKYRPRRNVAVSYRLHLQDHAGHYIQHVAARFCSGGESARRHAKSLQRPHQASRAGPSLSHAPALDMAAHWWPNDAKLAAAAVLDDEAALGRRWLPEVLAAAGAGPALAHRVTLAQVVPEHRVTARVEVDTASAPMLTLYAKADAETRGPATQAVMQALWDSPARRSGRLAVPRPLLWQPGSGLQWQCAVPGRALLDVCPRPDPSRAAAVGALVAALHATPTPAASGDTPDSLHRRLAEVQAVIGQVAPGLLWRLLPLVARLKAGLDAATAGPRVTLHGDLHARNVLADGQGAAERLALIDLDSARQGPAVLELGSWQADALYRARLEGHAPAVTGAACSAFLDAYAVAGGPRPSPQHIAWATAWQLLCQRAWRCAVNLKPGRFALLPELLTLAEAMLTHRSGEAAHVAATRALA